MHSARRYHLTLFLLVVVMTGAAFALGIGVMGLLDDDTTLSARAARVTANGQSPAAADVISDSRGSRFSLLDEVYAILDRDFVEPDRIDLADIRTAAINGVVTSLNDPHSAYLDAETYRLSSENINGVFQGIGARVQDDGGAITITSVFRGSPAEAAGVRPEDVILTVDGESTEGWSLQFAVARIRGERGTPVTLEVRHRDGVEETITIIRDNIIVPSVLSLQIQDRIGNPVTDIAYILITQFTEQTDDELRPLLQAASSAGIDRLIIDLRGNPGGLLTATVDTTGEFLDGGLVLTEVDRDGDEQTFNADSGGAGLGMQIVLLVDGGSASGAEVMAAALRDHGRAVVIGEQTLGKGTVNVPRLLTDGSVLYVSTARWLSPNGDLIEGIGVIPDIIVEPTDDDFQAQRDVQLFAAIDYLRGTGASASQTG